MWIALTLLLVAQFADSIKSKSKSNNAIAFGRACRASLFQMNPHSRPGIVAFLLFLIASNAHRKQCARLPMKLKPVRKTKASLT